MTDLSKDRDVYLAGPVSGTDSPHRWREEMQSANTLPGLSFLNANPPPTENPERTVMTCMKEIEQCDGMLVYYHTEDTWRTAVEAFVGERSGKPIECYLGRYSGRTDADFNSFLEFSVDGFYPSARDALNSLYRKL